MDHAFSKNVSRKTYINSGIINYRKKWRVSEHFCWSIYLSRRIFFCPTSGGGFLNRSWNRFSKVLTSLSQSSTGCMAWPQWISCFISLNLVSILSNLAFTVSNSCFIACNSGDGDCIPFISRIIDKMLPITLRKGAIKDAMNFTAFRKFLATRFSVNAFAVFSPVWTETITAGENTCTCTWLYAS